MQTKRTVLIADDERNIGILVKKLIHWEALNLECIAVVDNGEIALELIRTNRPDIVITDICMPVIDGLEMIRIAQSEKLGCEFIIISGYREFEYAHRAMEFGVVDYLLKPIIEEKINETLQKKIEKINGENQMDRHEEIKQSLSESNCLIRQAGFNNMVEGYTLFDPAKVRSLFQGEKYLCFDIKLDYVNAKYCMKVDQKHKDITIEQIRNLVDQCLEEASERLIHVANNFHVFCLVGYSDSQSEYVFRMISRILLKTKEYLREFDLQEVTIGIGEEKDGFSEIPDSIAEARCSAINRIKYGTGRLIPYSAIGHVCLTKEQIGRIIEKHYSELRMVNENGNVPELFNVIDKMFGELEETEGLDMVNVLQFAEFLEAVYIRIAGKKLVPDEKEQKEFSSFLQNSRSIHELHWVVKHHFSVLMNNMRLAAESQYTKPVRIAKEYMEENYRQHITLDSLAELVDLNSVYFSTVFKRETGENISTFLQNVRIEQAKKLLVETNETTAAIADMVGYSDARYFAKVFLKATGMRPATYRRLHA